MAGKNANVGNEIADYIDLENNVRGTDLTITGTANQTPALIEGIYDVLCTVDAYIKVAPDASTVTTSNGYLVKANNMIPVYVRANSKIGVIGTSGSMLFHKVK